MRIFKKVLAVGLSLAVCSSLVAPAFAASFSDLNSAIGGGDGYYGGENGIYRDGNTLTLEGQCHSG